MVNMAYCRFQNTLEALRECYQWVEGVSVSEILSLSDEELLAANELAELCCKIRDEWEL